MFESIDKPTVVPGVVELLCPACNTMRSPTDFLALPHDKRCSFCLPVASMEEAENRRMAVVKAKMDKLLDLTGGDTVDVPRLDRFLSGVFKSLGGEQAAARKWARGIEALIEKGAYAAACQQFQSLGKLLLSRERLAHDKTVSEQTDKELKSEAQLLAFSMLAEAAKDEASSKLVCELLRQHGFEASVANLKEVACA